MWDILEAAQTASQFVENLTFNDYLKDRKLQLAIERLLEIIGEASKRISPDFQEKSPEIPWHKMTAQRNVIIHEYGEIKKERIWTVVTENIPQLVSLLTPYVEAMLQIDALEPLEEAIPLEEPDL